LTISRLDLDGLGRTSDIAARIHELLPDLPLNFSIEDLCSKLDIENISEIDTAAFEAALIMDANKAAGAIVLAAGRSAQRRRFSIGHELGHFLLPFHKPQPGHPFEYSLEDLHLLYSREKDRRKRIEAEANRFAAALLMPPARVRKGMASSQPDLGDIIRLATEFGVSKEAMARTYVEAHREPVAVIILLHEKLVRVYRPGHFPWIEPRLGRRVPQESISFAHRLQPGELSEIEECEPETWFGEHAARRVEVTTEQLLGQSQGYAMLLLHAELTDE
jgi:Zn-dependent peptidase ImmA (M78 family)